MRYEFTFVVEGAGPEDDDVVVDLTEHLDAMLARAAGVDLLTIAGDGSDAIDAARDAILAVRFRVPRINFLHVDRDLVGISEIAQRVGRSRQNVTQWIAGERHTSRALEPFPKPEGVVGRARVWLWAEVNTWLRQLGLGDETPGPNRAEITEIDHLLRHDLLLAAERTAAETLWPVPYFWPTPNFRRGRVSGQVVTVSPYGMPAATSLAHQYVVANMIGQHHLRAWTSEPFAPESARDTRDEALPTFYLEVTQ